MIKLERYDLTRRRQVAVEADDRSRARAAGAWPAALVLELHQGPNDGMIIITIIIIIVIIISSSSSSI